MAQELATRTGYFSVLRWRSDATRDEAKNIAVLLVSEHGEFGDMRAAPVSSISPRLSEQGLLDQMLVGLQERFASGRKPNAETLLKMYESLHRSLHLTPPKPVVVPDVGLALDALYRAYVAPRSAGRSLTKGVILDRVVDTFRRRGLGVHRGVYINDFIFDAILEAPRRRQSVVEVLSFASGKKTWATEERDAGHFLYALGELRLPGIAVIQPPLESERNGATTSYERVNRWMQKERIPTFAPEAVDQIDLGAIALKESR